MLRATSRLVATVTPQAKWLSHDHEERLLSKKDMRFPAPAGAFRHQVLIQDYNKEYGYPE